MRAYSKSVLPARSWACRKVELVTEWKSAMWTSWPGGRWLMGMVVSDIVAVRARLYADGGVLRAYKKRLCAGCLESWWWWRWWSGMAGQLFRSNRRSRDPMRVR